MITIFVGITFVVIGFLYFYMPNIMIKLCEIAKKYLFNEKTIILNGKKIGLILFLLGCIVLTIKISRYYTHRDKYYLATKEFYNRNFKNSEKLCLEILSVHPKNIFVLELLGKIYFATGRYDLAKNIFLKIKNLAPSKSDQMEKYLQRISVNKKE